jgi:asparagine synthase (glutamine-hydrolysing)
MCGIVGIIAKTSEGSAKIEEIEQSVKLLNKRGPDAQNTWQGKNISLGHARLSIIDTSSHANQPFQSKDGRYILIFNGEIYNFKSLRTRLLKEFDIEFYTNSDTEVLFQWLVHFGSEKLNELHGFFGFAFHDTETQKTIIARDRYGIKPLLIYSDENQISFASELKALYPLGIKRELDLDSVRLYFKFNYIPQPYSIYKNVRKISPGEVVTINNEFNELSAFYYSMDKSSMGTSQDSYETAKKKIKDLLYQSVEERMVSDVPLGSFLSGGIDSSIIAGIASEKVDKLNTFSIGYADEPLFDETHYAEIVAKKFKTNHTVFKLKNEDLYNQLFKVLDYTCEPFADSSGLVVNVLSEKTREKVTVALSGDGADELFSGYNKHMAEFLARKSILKNDLIKVGRPIWSLLPKSRNSKIGNVARQLHKFSNGLRLSNHDRYWLWAGLKNEFELSKLLLKRGNDYSDRKRNLLSEISDNGDFNQVLLSDLKIVLTGDMLQKVDLNSMNNSLEVRVPFLDHRLVDYVNTLPVDYKINKSAKKRILQDTFREFLPEELYHRPKHGFEVPLLEWFRKDLSGFIFDELLNMEFVKEQNIFNPQEIRNLKAKLYSKSPGDSAATIWALIIFQSWWKNWHTAEW